MLWGGYLVQLLTYEFTLISIDFLFRIWENLQKKRPVLSTSKYCYTPPPNPVLLLEVFITHLDSRWLINTNGLPAEYRQGFL